jgi:hypothetical protein
MISGISQHAINAAKALRINHQNRSIAALNAAQTPKSE